MPTRTIAKWRISVLTFSVGGFFVATILLCLQSEKHSIAVNPWWNSENLKSRKSKSGMEGLLRELNKAPDDKNAKSKIKTLDEIKIRVSANYSIKQNVQLADVSEEKNNTKSNKNLSEKLICGNEVKHIAFVKVHKAGSTTLMNILQRFAYKKELFIALPQSGNLLDPKLSNRVKSPQTFDMIINHVDPYNRKRFEQLLSRDTKYIGLIRDPLEVTISAFQFYTTVYHEYKHVKGKNKLITYLRDRERYEHRDAKYSYTNNRMSYDFGMNPKNFHNPKKISEFLDKLDSEMDIVLVLERLAESLVFLKRKFCWQMKDILFIAKNKNKDKPEMTFTPEELAYHRNFSLADNMLYDHFTKRFLEHLSEFDLPDFQEEVDCFTALLVKVRAYCLDAEQNNFVFADIPLLFIDQSRFNERFNVTIEDCRLMMYSEWDFCDISRAKQEEILARGDN